MLILTKVGLIFKSLKLQFRNLKKPMILRIIYDISNITAIFASK